MGEVYLSESEVLASPHMQITRTLNSIVIQSLVHSQTTFKQSIVHIMDVQNFNNFNKTVDFFVHSQYEQITAKEFIVV